MANNILFDYGLKIDGYELGALNDREVRAAAGIMFLLGIIVLFVGIGYGHIIAARVYLPVVWVDLTIRLINPSYSPFMLLGRLFVRNQKPEYVGAIQKRFAWLLGWILFLPMLNWFVIHWDITFYKVLLCVLCLSVIFMESAFGVCFGCALYTFFTRKKAQNCPGDACEIQTKDISQKFTPWQKIIVFFSSLLLFVGIYLFLAKTESKTFFGEFLHELVLSKAQLDQENEAAMDTEFEKDNDNDF